MSSSQHARVGNRHTFVIITMQNYLASFGEFVLVIQGAIFVVIVLAFRKGVVGELSDWWQARRKAG